RVLREVRGRALDTQRDLLATALDDRIEMRRPIVALNELLGLFRRETALALEILAKAARANGQVARQQRDAVVENVDVGDVVPDVEKSDDAVHRVGVIDL